MLGTYVDDLLFAGDEEFEEHSKKLDKVITMKSPDDNPLTFAGLRISRTNSGGYTIDQEEYIGKLILLDPTAPFQ